VLGASSTVAWCTCRLTVSGMSRRRPLLALLLLAPLLPAAVDSVDSADPEGGGAEGDERLPTYSEVRADPTLLDDAIKSSDVVVFSGGPGHEQSAKTEAALDEARISFRKLPITPFQEAIKSLVYTDMAPSVWVYGEYIGAYSEGTLPWHGVQPMLESGRLLHFLKTGWLHGRQFRETGNTQQGREWLKDNHEGEGEKKKHREAAARRVNGWEEKAKQDPDHDL
jgi:hypothetical protein